MKYVFIEKHQTEFSIKAMCRVFKVAWSGLPGLNVVTSQARAGSPGSSAILLSARHLLRQSSVMVRLVLPEYWLNTISKLSRAKNSRRLTPVNYRVHSLPASENLLKQNFYVSDPNRKWVGDITYLRTEEGWLYLVVIDLWSRAVISWSISPRMIAKRVCDMLQVALWWRKHLKNVIVHMDRGGQYCSANY